MLLNFPPICISTGGYPMPKFASKIPLSILPIIGDVINFNIYLFSSFASGFGLSLIRVTPLDEVKQKSIRFFLVFDKLFSPEIKVIL